jgi:hypothetical protein|tara:strand:- start:666 stop:1091 length:426 start_codon:yes stop_codon:yes gene_type:complete
MKRLLLLLLLAPIPAFAVPVTPNFQSGSMTSHTETTSKVSEVISVMEYQSGWQLTLTGNNITTDADSLLPAAASTANTVNGVVSTWTGLDATNMPNFTIKDTTKAWQFTSSLTQPGLKSHTVITRTTDITSVTDTVSTFSQ